MAITAVPSNRPLSSRRDFSVAPQKRIGCATLAVAGLLSLATFCSAPAFAAPEVDSIGIENLRPALAAPFTIERIRLQAPSPETADMPSPQKPFRIAPLFYLPTDAGVTPQPVG